MVMSYSGYDIEDAIVLNKASVDRGFGRCILTKKFTTNVATFEDNSKEKLCAPTDSGNQYHAIDEDGICHPGSQIKPGDALTHKLVPVPDNMPNTNSVSSNISLKSSASSFKGAAPVFVDKVLLTANDDEPVIVKVLTRHVRRPELGDKFSSRHGQKGVVGNIVNEEDLPFNESVSNLFLFFFFVATFY